MMNWKNSGAAVALVAICLLLGAHFYLPARSDALHRDRAPAAVPSALRAAPADATAVPVATNGTKNEADAVERERLLLDRKKLRQANATLQTTLQRTEDDQKRAEAEAQMMANLSGKLLDGSRKPPQTLAEEVALINQNLSDVAKFKAKWGDRVPAADTPEATEYARGSEEIMSGLAALLQFGSDGKTPSPFAQPGSLADFQTTSLTGSLALRDDQAQAVKATLDGYFESFISQGLNMSALPSTGADSWSQQRAALSQQAYASITAILTPEQAAAFKNLYPSRSTWMFTVTVGLPGIGLTF